MEALSSNTQTHKPLTFQRIMPNQIARKVLSVLENHGVGTIQKTVEEIVNDRDVEKICLIHREDITIVRECDSPPCCKCLGIIKQTGEVVLTIVAHNNNHKEALRLIASEIKKLLRTFAVEIRYKSIVGEVLYTDCLGEKCE